ncbi:MAG: hypothetical protein HOW73_44110 [Polyangiaceae bacterium]|nr:hypothetical protein [Polyangiaceae bacterium]
MAYTHSLKLGALVMFAAAAQLLGACDGGSDDIDDGNYHGGGGNTGGGGADGGGASTGGASTGGASVGGGGVGGGSCGNVKGYSELGDAFAKCTGCHSSELTTPVERQAAPVGVDYDTYALATQHLDDTRARIANDQDPPAGSPSLTAQQKSDLLSWIDCGAPE